MFSAEMTTGMILGFIGVALSLISCSMRNMQALRQVSIVCNLVFITYGVLEAQIPTIVLNSILLPLNGWRLYQIKQLVRDIESATSDSPVTQWLLPHMAARSYKAGQILFHRGEQADEIFYIQEGEILLKEINKTLYPGELFGELGIFSTAGLRTLGASCKTDCKLYSMNREAVYKLYYQQPKLGFHLMGLMVSRLGNNDLLPLAPCDEKTATA